MKEMTNQSEGMKILMELLGLPKYVHSFTLRVSYGERPTVECTYWPTEPGSEHILLTGDTVTQLFELVPKT